MACRRKLKKERELLADLTKLFSKFCNESENCYECPLYNYLDSFNEDSCIIAYIEYLLNTHKNNKEEDK